MDLGTGSGDRGHPPDGTLSRIHSVVVLHGGGQGTGFKHFNPEAMTVIGSGEAQELLVLSDDGNQQKKAAEPAFRSFRVKP